MLTKKSEIFVFLCYFRRVDVLKYGEFERRDVLNIDVVCFEKCVGLRRLELAEWLESPQVSKQESEEWKVMQSNFEENKTLRSKKNLFSCNLFFLLFQPQGRPKFLRKEFSA